ncbi:WxL domain-containing protein [Enterococcus faecalis]|uniref:WxL domain-containing protein n=1 Tax=Enterococcus faecalis TaxID=1351 RepID=UPI00370E5339|nr:WxL domain-containing protein [Enterococcus faecalis]EIA1375899.1 WxL domain-containing protein [Enterococcus faecalis]
MKQIKFRHLATLGLCCSLLANSFTGITAIAETVTIESSPTAETVASEATTETEKKTKVEQTEQTKEAKNQQEHKETEATSQDTSEEDNQKEVAQPTEATTSSLEETLPKIESRGIPLKTIVYPKVQYDFVDETGAPFTTPLSFSGNYQARKGGGDAEIVALPAPYNKLSAQVNGTGSYILSINNSAGFPLTPQIIEKYGAGGTTPSTKYRATFLLDKLNIVTPLKYVDSIAYAPTADSYWSVYMYKGFNITTGIFDNSIEEGRGTPVDETSNVPDRTFKKNTSGSFEIIQPSLLSITSGGFADWVAPGYNSIILRGFDGTNTIKSKMIYKVTRKQVTEKFVDGTGVAITPPTGFTQNKKTPMTNNNFTYTSAKALPDTYRANGKAYKFKGWYKGKTKPATLKTTKTPSYAVTYDDNDDLNVVYEEIEAFDFPALTYQFGFVDESGKRVDASTIGLTYDKWRGEGFATNAADSGNPAYYKTISLEKGQIAPTKNNLKEIAYPAQSIEILSDRSSLYSVANLTFTLPKYYENISVYNKSGTFDVSYPFPSIYHNNNTKPTNGDASWVQLKKSGNQSFVFNKTTSGAPIDIQVPLYLREAIWSPKLTSDVGSYYTLDKPIYYHLTNRKVTENFVDASGTKITPPTGFTQGNQIPMTSDTFKYTAAKALPTSYTADGKTYLFQGWYKGKTKPNTLTTSTTPTYDTTFDDNDDMTAVYKEASISANLTMRGAVDVIDNGGTMEYWEVLLKNTGEAPLTSIKIKPTTEWESGISTPTELFILGTGQNTKVRPITKEQWEAGFEIPLDKSLPVGGQLTINLIGTKVTGQPNQVLKAAVEVSGNFNKLTASDTVRIKDLDQETKEPTGEGFISVPTFDFGQVGVASTTKQHGLKKAADYYGNGTRNPYVRISKTQPNWSLTAQLSQPKSATDSLPTATRLLLGAAPVSSFSNYNQPTELKNAIGTTNAINLTANNAATSIIANQQFTGSDVYQLDFTFDNIKLEVPANQGTAGQQYQAAVTWNLVTGP